MAETSSREAEGISLNVLFSLLLAIAVVLLWIVPLTSSFWIDEIVSAFIIRNGGDHPSLAVAPQVVESIYYALPSASEKLFGFSEIAYRLPSLLAMGVALFLITRIAIRLIHPQAGWFALFGCLALGGFNYQAADARPYALGTCVAAAGILFLIRWLDEGRWQDATLFALFAALLWRVHLIYWPIYIVFLLYAILRRVWGETRVGWLPLAGVFLLITVALIPVLLTAVSILQEAGSHVIVPVPTLRAFVNSLKAGLVVGCFAGIGVCRWLAVTSAEKTDTGATGLRSLLRFPARKTQIAEEGKSPSKSAIFLVLAYWLGQPLALFVFSHLTGNSVYVSRYLYVALPGVALTAALCVAYYQEPQYWKKVTLLLAAVVLLNSGAWGDGWPRHDFSDWRSAARALNQLKLGADTPVVCPSPFIEANPPDWSPSYSLPGFLYGHLQIYPIESRPYLFPFEYSREGEEYALSFVREELQRSGRFVVYGGAKNVRDWTKWFGRRPELADWQEYNVGPFGNVEIVVFEKSRGISKKQKLQLAN